VSTAVVATTNRERQSAVRVISAEKRGRQEAAAACHVLHDCLRERVVRNVVLNEDNLRLCIHVACRPQRADVVPLRPDKRVRTQVRHACMRARGGALAGQGLGACGPGVGRLRARGGALKGQGWGA